MPLSGCLGNAAYDALLYTRGHDALLGPLTWTKIEWTRTYLDTSTATITLDADNVQQCCGLLGMARPWSTEISVMREGEGEIWRGVVMTRSPTGNTGGIQLSCLDLSVYLGKRLIHSDHKYAAPVDVSDIFEAYWVDAIAVENGMNMSLTISDAGVKNMRDSLAVDHNVARSEIDEVVSLGCDWTQLRSATIAGGAARGEDVMFTLTDEHFVTRPSVIDDGTNMVTDYTVIGQGGGDDNSTAISSQGRVEDDEGILLEGVDTSSDAADQKAADAEVDYELTNFSSPIISASGGILGANAPIVTEDLIPGTLFLFAISDCLGEVVSTYRITGVSASIDATGEQVSIDIEPAGTLVGI